MSNRSITDASSVRTGLGSGSTQHGHGHPVFSLDDRWVLYNSMLGQAHNVYVLHVHGLA